MSKTAGNSELPPLSQELRDRLGEQIARNTKSSNGHHLWTARTNARGYGMLTLSFRGRHFVLRAHRAAYAVEHGRWPKPENDIHHKCGVESCVNPDHLEELPAEEHTGRERKTFGFKNQYTSRSGVRTLDL